MKMSTGFWIVGIVAGLATTVFVVHESDGGRPYKGDFADTVCLS